MTKRKSLSKKIRFEVFKRDSFACQYCGAAAPEALLRVDHINPVAAGGDNDLLNLITACEPCNQGKGARKLDDSSVVVRQKAQIDALNMRREQLEMMLQWRDAVEREKLDVVEEVASRLSDRGGFTPNENGRTDIRKWLKRFTLSEILSALDEAFDVYMRFDGDEPDQRAWETAFKKIPAIAAITKQSVEKPYLRSLFYLQGILRRRTGIKYLNCIDALESLHLDGASVDALTNLGKTVSSWEDFAIQAEQLIPASPESAQ